jgi:hypothetical protein
MSFDARLLRITIVIWLSVGVFVAAPIVSGGPNQVYTPFNETCSALGLSGVPLYEDSVRGWMARRTSVLCRMKLKTRTDRELLVALSSYEGAWSLLVLVAFLLIRRVPSLFRW